MLLGYVRDYAAYILLTLPGEEDELTAEVVINTGSALTLAAAAKRPLSLSDSRRPLQ